MSLSARLLLKTEQRIVRDRKDWARHMEIEAHLSHKAAGSRHARMPRTRRLVREVASVSACLAEVRTRRLPATYMHRGCATRACVSLSLLPGCDRLECYEQR